MTTTSNCRFMSILGIPSLVLLDHFQFLTNFLTFLVDSCRSLHCLSIAKNIQTYLVCSHTWRSPLLFWNNALMNLARLAWPMKWASALLFYPFPYVSYFLAFSAQENGQLGIFGKYSCLKYFLFRGGNQI